MKNGMRVFDADSHCGIRPIWQRFVDLQGTFARAHSRWGQEMNETSGKRIHVCGPVPLTDIDVALREIRYGYEELGVRCFSSRPNPCRGHNLGDDHIVYETDFPHPESKFPRATECFLELTPEHISMDSKRKILWDNAIDLYRPPERDYPEHLINT